MKQGFWFVTPKTGRSRKFATTKEMVAYLKVHPGCIVSWVKAQPQ